jgi:hypothetical protein
MNSSDECVEKLGRELRVGDVLLTSCGEKTITHFEPHPGLTQNGQFHSARIAKSGAEWGMTVFDDEVVKVVPLIS